MICRILWNGGNKINILFGKIDNLFHVFLILTFLDYITGVLSTYFLDKINSSIGHKGIIKKLGVIVCVILARQIDALNLYPSIEVKNIVIIFFIANEIISIIENLKKIGIKTPKIIEKIKELLKNSMR